MIAIIEAILKLGVLFAEIYSQRRTLEAGKAEALLAVMENANERITKAIAARRAVTRGMPDNNDTDPYIRD